MILNILMVALGLTLSTYLFKKAAGTLNIRKLNLISYTYYLFLLQTYIGTSLIFLGDRGHYTLKYVLNESSINKTFYYVLLTAILFPLVVIIVYKIFKVDMNNIYDEYLNTQIYTDNEKATFYIVLGIAIVCITLMISLFIKIGYIPILKIIFPTEGFNYKTERIRVSQVSIINQYVRNILILSLIPVLSYIAFVYSCMTKSLRWISLFIVLFLASICTKTYNFAKTPVIFYLFTFVIIYIIINNGIKRRYFYTIICSLILVIFFLYKIMGFKLEISLYNGPIGRVLFTQAGTLIYHFDFFPNSFPYLEGRSFSNTILRILGTNMTSIRSAKIIMAFYGSRSVYDGIAGVMNTLFIGEAYANFGALGVVVSIVYLGILFGLILWIFTSKFKKTALNVALLGIFTSELANTTQGGFFDFLYNANMIAIVLIIIFINYGSKLLGKIIMKKSYSNKNI